MEVTYGKRKHRGGLEESLSTSVGISFEEFKELLNDTQEIHSNYTFYDFDSRCNQILFLGKPGLEYMWLYIQLKLDVEHSIESKLINTIEQLAHITQEQEEENTKYKRVFSIIKKKGVDVGYLKTCKTLEEYNSNCWDDEEDFNKKLTQEEFILLKEYFKNEN